MGRLIGFGHWVAGRGTALCRVLGKVLWEAGSVVPLEAVRAEEEARREIEAQRELIAEGEPEPETSEGTLLAVFPSDYGEIRFVAAPEGLHIQQGEDATGWVLLPPEVVEELYRATIQTSFFLGYFTAVRH